MTRFGTLFSQKCETKEIWHTYMFEEDRTCKITVESSGECHRSIRFQRFFLQRSSCPFAQSPCRQAVHHYHAGSQSSFQFDTYQVSRLEDRVLEAAAAAAAARVLEALRGRVSDAAATEGGSGRAAAGTAGRPGTEAADGARYCRRWKMLIGCLAASSSTR